MSHKILILSALLSSTLAIAHIKLDVDLTINKQNYKRHITKEIVLEDNGTILLDCDDLAINIHVKEYDASEGVLVEADIIKKSDGQTNEYLARPAICAAWDKQAKIKIGSKVNGIEEELTLLVTVSPLHE